MYGPCEEETCGGMCEEVDVCTADNCACKEDE